MTPDQQNMKKDVNKESRDIHQQTEEVHPQNLPSLQGTIKYTLTTKWLVYVLNKNKLFGLECFPDKGTQDYKVQQPLPPERIDVYYFDHGNSG